MNIQKPVVGIIGGGQLGSMLAQAAKKINIKVIILSDDKDAPAYNYADQFIHSDYNDNLQIEKFVSLVDIVTFEFENIPFEVLNKISKIKKVLPLPKINQIVQDRRKEKSFVNDLGIKTTEWSFINSKEDIKNNKHLLPGILKTCKLGYDGKGQYIISSVNDLHKISSGITDCILEKIVNLKLEISVIITRFHNGECSIYEPIENNHQEQILKYSKIPANINQGIFYKAQSDAKLLAEKLDYVGTMCVEYFLTMENELLVNEIAPRVHNSGHLTINAFNISQFENHIRAVSNLKRIEIKKNSNAKMTNIIGSEINEYRGKHFKKNEYFFDYFKKEIKKKRKMGHLTTVI
tara:strand:- start:298 stop:1344 length:1047 start_codon:yes stop_codon:yes gene_type:complete